MSDAARTKRAIAMMAQVSEHAKLERIRQLEADLTAERTGRWEDAAKAADVQRERDNWHRAALILIVAVVFLGLRLMAQIGGCQ